MHHCLNCNELLSARRPPKFCPACGQETRVKPPTLREFAQQFGGAYLATEGALWRTLKLLLTKPGELTAQYLAGRRKHYVLPLRLYLTISVLVLLLVRLLAGDMAGAIQFDPDPGTEGMSFSIIGDDTGAGLKNGVFYCNNLPNWICKRLKDRMDLAPADMQRQLAQLGPRALANLGPAMFVMLPLFALWLKLVYANRALRYTEHLVFALHLHAFWFLALLLTLTGQSWLAVLAGIAVPLYGWLAMRRVYGGRRWLLMLRACVLSSLYMVTLLFAALGLAAWTFLA